MAENPSPSAVGTNPQDSDGIDVGAATLIDLVWPLDSGQAVTAETAWKAVHTALRSIGIAEDEGWTERAVAKGLEIALASRAVAQGGQEPTISSVKAFLTSQDGSTGDYRKFSALVAKAKARFLQDRKAEPFYVPPHEPAKSTGAAHRQSKQAEQVVEDPGPQGAEPATGLISFNFHERVVAAHFQQLTKEKDTALQDQRNAHEVARNAMESTISLLSNQLTIEQQRSTRSQRMNLVLTVVTVVICVLALGTISLFMSQRQPAHDPTSASPPVAVPSTVPPSPPATPTATEPPAPAHAPTEAAMPTGGGKSGDVPVDPPKAESPSAPQPDAIPKP